MTTERPRGDAPTGAAPPTRRRRPRQAPAGRALATGAALTATGLFVAVMGVGSQSSATIDLVSQPAPAVTTAPATVTPLTTIVVIHRPAAVSSTPVAAAPSAGRAVPAPQPTTRAAAPAPAATSSAS